MLYNILLCIVFFFKKKPYFSLEGLVGSGKMTVLKFLVGTYMKERKVCHVVTEPLNVFLHYKDGAYNPLHEVQRDPIRNIVPGQIHIITESRKHYSTFLGQNAPVVLSTAVCFPLRLLLIVIFVKGSYHLSLKILC